MKWGALFSSTASHLFWMVVTISAVVLVFVVWLTLRRENRRRLKARLFAGIVSVLSLMAMGLRPRWSFEVTPGEAILITPGADADLLRSLPDTISASLIFSLEEEKKWKSISPEVQQIPSLGYLRRHFPEVSLLHVIGHGLPAYEWLENDSLEIRPHFASLKPGIKNLSWPREITVGQPVRMQGAITGFLHDSMVYLFDPGGAVDSVKISTSADVPFEFIATPRDTGKYLYRIRVEENERQALYEEMVDVHVISPEPTKALFLEKAVSFETRHLKNWLSKRHAQLAIRSAISRERFRYEFHNRARVDLSRMTPHLLQEFDLLIIDAMTLAELSDSELQALRSAVKWGGLGMLIAPDESLFDDGKKFLHREFFLDFQFEEFTGLEYRLIKPSWQGFRDSLMSAIPAEPFAIKPGWGMKPLVYDEMDHVVAATYRRGPGLIGLSLIRDSYRWVLEGRSGDHAAYWSHVLSALARKSSQDQWSLSASMVPIVDQPLPLTVETISPLPVGVVATENGQEDSLFLKQDSVEPRRWTGVFWPRAEGWHRVSTLRGKSFWFYVFKKENWQTLQQAQRVESTRRFALRNQFRIMSSTMQTLTRTEPVSLFWFFLIFLLCSAFLWIERKFL